MLLGKKMILIRRRDVGQWLQNKKEHKKNKNRQSGVERFGK